MMQREVGSAKNRWRLGVIMDSLSSLHVKKDSTLAMLEEAQRRDYDTYYFSPEQLFLREATAYGMASQLSLTLGASPWYTLATAEVMALSECDVILMRKDPPFNDNYIYMTYVLDAAEKAGVLVINKPQALRDANEKVYATHFPECIPPTIVTASIAQLQAFSHEHQEIVCKPLNAMAGKSIFRLRQDDVNKNAVFDLLTQQGTTMIMAQKFIPAITEGDKRIILINGKPIPHMLARIPQPGDWRGNLAQGAKGEVQALGSKEQRICELIGPDLIARGLYFVGIDIIGDYLTEINVTSPTGIREIEAGAKTSICAELFAMIEALS